MLYLFRIQLFFVITLLLVATGCNQSDTQESFEASEESVKAVSAIESPINQNRKIARTVNLRFQVQNLTESSNRLETLLPKYGAQLVQSQQYSGDGSLEATYTIRVKQDKLDPLLKELQNQSIFLDSKSMAAEDITMQYVDVEARIKAKQAVEQRYLQLLQKADKVPDILAIEAELNKVREELDVAQAQIKEMEKQTSYSTIMLTMYQFVPTSYQDRTSFYNQTISALEGGWQLLKYLTIGFFYLWPLWIIIPLLIWSYRRIKRMRKPAL